MVDFDKGFVMNDVRRPTLRVLSLLGLIALAGCGTMTQVAPGTPLQTVISQYGQPTVSCPNPNGGQRVVWSQEPSGVYVWRADVDANGTVSGFTQVLAAKEFEVLNQGTWDTERVKCHFGPPSQTKTYPNNPDQLVWLYQYMGDQPSGFMLLYVTINKATNRVLKYATAPNPELNPLLAGP